MIENPAWEGSLLPPPELCLLCWRYCTSAAKLMTVIDGIDGGLQSDFDGGGEHELFSISSLHGAREVPA